MKNIGILLMFAILLLGCDKDDVNVSNAKVTLDYQVGNISNLELSHAFQASVNYDPTITDLSIEINENLEEYLEVDINGSTLSIGLSDNISLKGNATLKVNLTTDELVNISCSGASRVDMLNLVDQDNLNLVLSGASQFKGVLNVTSFESLLSGASMLNLQGNITNANMVCSGASTVKDFTMTVENLVINCSGGSNVNLSVNQSLDVVLSGDSRMIYSGNPQIVNQQVTGGSNLTKLD